MVRGRFLAAARGRTVWRQTMLWAGLLLAVLSVLCARAIARADQGECMDPAEAGHRLACVEELTQIAGQGVGYRALLPADGGPTPIPEDAYKLTLTKVVSPTAAYPGDTVTYSYRLTNEGTRPMPASQVVDDRCEPSYVMQPDGKRVVGDTNLSGMIDPGETFWFAAEYVVEATCEQTTIVNTASGRGIGLGRWIYSEPVTATLQVLHRYPNVEISAQPAEAMLTCVVNQVTLTATATGDSDAYTYAWSTGEAGPTISVSDAGVYTVTVSGSAECPSQHSVVVGEDRTQPEPNLGDDRLLTCANPTAVLSAGLAVPSEYTYLWYRNGVLLTGETAETLLVKAAGAYTVEVTSKASGCTGYDAVVVTEDKDAPGVEVLADTTELTCDVTVATLTAMASGGVKPYGYAWSTGSDETSIDVTTPGIYTVTVTGANGCAGSDSITITQSAEKPVVDIESTATELTCGVTDVTLTAMVGGGVGPYTYLWSTGSTETSIDVTAPGTYKVTVTGSNGCSSSDSEIITQDIRTPQVSVIPAEAELTCDVTQVTLTALASGGAEPYAYVWNTGATTESIVVMEPGAYTVRAKGDNGCDASASALVTQDIREPAVEISATAAELTCEVGAATLTAMVSGGAEPYTYLWSTGATSESIVVTEPGAYTVTAKGTNGCIGEDSIVVTESTDRPNVSIVAPDKVLTCDITEVTLTAQVAAETGEPPFAYAWSTGSTDTSISVAAAGTYSVTVAGANGCAGTASVVITEDKEPPVVSIATPQPLSATVTEVVLDATASAGTPPYTCLWNTGESTEDITVSATGTYTVTVTGANGCSAEISVDVVYQGLTIVKTGPTEAAELGDILDYTITVTNVSDVTLTNVRVVDAKLGIDQSVGDLAPGASAVVTGSYQVTEADIPADLAPGDTGFVVSNTATATSDQVGPVDDDWNVTVNYEFQAPQAALSIGKTGPDGQVTAGDCIQYALRIENVGQTLLHNVRVLDPMLGLDRTIAELGVGMVEVIEMPYVVQETDVDEEIGLTNIATAWSDLAPEVVATWHVDTVAAPAGSPDEPEEPGDDAPDETLANRADVTVIVWAGWDGIPVTAWVGGTEQETRYTARDAQGDPQVMWTLYPPAGETWTVTVGARLPEGLDPDRWAYVPLTPTAVQIAAGEQHTIELQLIDEGVPQAEIAPAAELPRTGHLGSGMR